MDDTGKGADMGQGICTVADCGQIHRAKGLCGRHYAHFRRRGMLDTRRPTAEERFWAKVDKSDGPIGRRPDLGSCWLWTGSTLKGGYGFWQYGGRINKTKTLAHRYSYELAYGPIGDGLHIDHLCGTRACVRPTHLEAVTQAENNRRAADIRIRRTHCPQGHEYAGDNLALSPKNQYICRTCVRARNRAKGAVA